MVHLPNFIGRRERLRPVRFVPVTQAFQPQVLVRARQDLSGWVDRRQRIKWELGAGKVGPIDADKAREFAIKGYVDVMAGEVAPASEDEVAEVLSTVTILRPGG